MKSLPIVLEVLHHRSGVLALAKPAGLPTQAVPGIDSVEGLIRRQLFGEAVAVDLAAGRRRHPGGFLGVPHRLDRPVSGVLLVATTPRAARQLSRQFERRQINKDYLAVVELVASDLVADEELFEWRDVIRKIPDEARAEIVATDTPGGREAVTHGRPLAVRDGRLLLELHPRTGRTHQLRLQAAARGLPIVGDQLYGNADTVANSAASSLALHAHKITFRDPETGEPVSVCCPLPDSPLWADWPQVR